MDSSERVAEALRRELVATLLIGERPVRTKYIVEPRTGRLIVNVDPDLLSDEDDLTLHAPDEHEDSLQARVGFEGALDPRHDGACDRWMAYHLRELGPGFARFGVLAARLGSDRESVVDGDDLDLANPLASDESRLCKAFNADRERLRSLLDLSSAETGHEAPTLVGVDAHGIHLRAAFGVRRIAFETPAATGVEAESAIESLLARVE